MGKIVAIMNRKGGVGKTTTALCLAGGLAARGARVLMVDLDQQHNATKQYGAAIDGVTTVYDLLTDRSARAADGIQRTARGDIIAGDDLVNNVEAEMSGMLSRETMLADALAPVRGEYDWIVVDCPPALGIVAVNVLVAADRLIVPMLCDGFCMDSFAAVKRLVDQVTASPRLNPGLEISGMLITQYEPRQRLTRSFDEQLPALAEAAGTRVFGTRIRRCCKVREAQQLGVPLGEYAPGCTTDADYSAWVDEIVGEGLLD